MTKRKQGAATEFYRCTACEVNNIYKGEKLPHLYVDVTKPNTRVLLTDPETIRHVCCETTYIPMNFSKTNSLLPSASYPEEDANHRPNVSVDSMNLSLFNHNSQNNLQEPSTSREPSEPAAKKPKLEDRFDQSEDIWTDFGVMVASMTRRTAQKNLDKAFRLQQGIFKFLHDFEGGR
ncbi:hypothetical protein L596_014219 [Steinernema carpocapsae]|uniref:Uncharacterized protein n=1 Tax=Steinernema carpocapsae TaxID=34508 RepID=A0A4U5NC29_STECR|nr:hypothetical protein L596_014219 [Steinernema carpocapsae]